MPVTDNVAHMSILTGQFSFRWQCIIYLLRSAYSMLSTPSLKSLFGVAFETAAVFFG